MGLGSGLGSGLGFELDVEARAVAAGSTSLEGAEELVDARPLAHGHDEADGRLVRVGVRVRVRVRVGVRVRVRVSLRVGTMKRMAAWVDRVDRVGG